MNQLKNVTFFILILLLTNCNTLPDKNDNNKPNILALHLLDYTNDKKLDHLGKQLPILAKKGINTLFLEVDYHFDFKSHPELRSSTGFITKQAAKKFKDLCKQYKIRLIPQFQSLGHQSWGATTFELLTTYPELDATPGAYPNNEGIYCREWDPYNPKVNKIVFALIDEILEAFEADGLHIGMDEVFLITSPYAVSTKDKNPATVFAKVVNDFHDYFSKQKDTELFIWGDRLIDGTTYKYGAWESSLNGTAPAIDLIPKDIVICDWHYEPRSNYPSIPMFIDKGFKVLPSSWRKKDGIEKLINHSYQINNPKMLGHLFTTWGYVDSLKNYRPLNEGLKIIENGKFHDVSFDFTYNQSKNEAMISLQTSSKNLDIYYTTDGSTPSLNSIKYNAPIAISKSTTFKATSYLNKSIKSNPSTQSYTIHKGLAATIVLNTPYSQKFEVNNKKQALVDGALGSTGFTDGKWLGFDATDMSITMKLQSKTSINTVRLNLFNDHANWIYSPESIEIHTSTNNIDFKKIDTKIIPLSTEKIQQIAFDLNQQNIQSIKLIGKNRPIPTSKKDAGKNTWIFIDEIRID